ncbi:E3 ubiquitin-protein ligase huwe1 [Homalodisca vitripennis]|nr:E3 ubiquitin-protein ligase huwe1 [Homalodisca vitripennis]
MFIEDNQALEEFLRFSSDIESDDLFQDDIDNDPDFTTYGPQNLAHEAQVMKSGLSQLSEVLSRLNPLCHRQKEQCGSILLEELARAPNMETAFSTPSATPLLHAMAATHGYVIMFVHVCRTGQLDIRTISINNWGSELGLTVLAQLADLYSALVWESTVLLALCSEDSNREFSKEEIFKYCPPSMMRMQSESMDISSESQEENMEVDDEKFFNRSSSKSTSVIPPNIKLKYIKPLLGASSRLGRALAELFGLLVKLCVGFPVRTRRGNHLTNTPVSPTPSAHNVANSLAALLTRGLSPHYLPNSPVAKFKLTYLICSVGFTQPMLFDEKRYPYHLMLLKFVKSKGQKAFFDTFLWALSGGGTCQQMEATATSKDLPEGTGEFIDAWLLLLEKMANPKAIYESTHMLPSRFMPGSNYFSSLKYVQQVHRMAFNALSYLWGRKPFPNYGARITETMLTIYRHILRGDMLLEERKQKESETTVLVNPAASEGRRGGAGREHRPEVNPTELTQLMDMGFSREHCYEALILTATLEHATDYLLNNFFPHNVQPSPSTECDEQDLWEEPLDTDVLARFSNQVLQTCLDYVESMPETVYRACDLLTIIIRRNGESYCYKLLNALATEVGDGMITANIISWTWSSWWFLFWLCQRVNYSNQKVNS